MAIASRPPAASVWKEAAVAADPSANGTGPRTTANSSAPAFQRHINASVQRTSSSPVRVVSAVVSSKVVSPAGSPRLQEVQLKRASFTLPAKADSTTAVTAIGLERQSDNTPELSSSDTWSSSGTSPVTSQRSTPAMPSSSSAKIGGDPSVVMAARDRPMFQKERAMPDSVSSSSVNSAGSSSNGSTTPLRVKNGNAPTRRQLMPAIPIRRGSAVNESSSAKEHALQPKTSAPAMGNQTNIQSLAQAIAARAQHVAATKAAAALHQQQAKQSTPPTTNDASASATPTNATSDTVLNSGDSVLPWAVQGRSSNDNTATNKRISVLSLPSDYGDDGSDNGEHNASAAAMPTKQDGVGSELSRAERDRVAQSFRWSQGDWADYAAALSHEIDVGDSLDSDYVSKQKTPTGPTTVESTIAEPSVIPPSTDDMVHVRRNSQIGQPRAIDGDGLTGLGLGGLSGAVAPDDDATETDSDGHRRGLIKSTSDPSNPTYNSPLLAQVAARLASPKTPEADSAADSATTPDESVTPSSTRRRTRPAPLSLVSSPSASRSLASPSMGGRTPPPTMPPTEPLPPLPADLGLNMRRLRTSVDSSKHGPLSYRSSGYSDAPAPNSDDAPSQEPSPKDDAGPGVGKRDRKRASDPTETRWGGADGALPLPRKNSLPHNALQSAANVTPASLSAQSIALVRANRMSTLAGAEHAQAMLVQMQREPTYDELRAARRGSQASSSASSSAQHSVASRHSGTSAKTDAAAAAIAGVNKVSAPTPVGEEEEEEELRESVKKRGGDGEEDEEGEMEEEEEEAIVTRVVGTTVKRTPSIVRIASSPRRAAAQRQSNPAVGSLVNDASDVAALRRNSETTTMSAQADSAMPPRSASANQSRSSIAASALVEAEAAAAAAAAAAATAADTSTSSSLARGRPSLSMAAHPQRVVVAGTDNTSVDTTTGALSVRTPSVVSLQGLTGTWTPTPIDTPTLLQTTAVGGGGYGNPNKGDTSGGGVGIDSSRGSLASSPVERRTAQQHRGDDSRMTMRSFAEVASAFKQLQAEKRTLERIIRATTPLDGLGQNGASLAEYLTVMTGKMDASSLEIRKLLDLLDQQRSVMDYMVDTHRLESEAQADELEELKDDFDAVCEEADTHRDNAIRLTEELDAAQRDAVAARSETLRLKASWQEEEKRKESTVKLLRQARSDLGQLERERDEARAAVGRAGGDAGALGERQVQRTTSPDASLMRIAALETELAEAKRSNAELQRQIQQQQEQQREPLHASASSDSPPATRPHTASVPLSDADDLERERDMLRERLFQQEKDVAELRAQIALGGGGSGNTSAMSAAAEGDTSAGALAAAVGVGSLPAAREDQVRLLMTQMTEQRAREAQIRKAYRQLRDDYRKVQSAQHNDRKRNQATYSFLGGGANALPGSTPPTSASGLQHIELAAAAAAAEAASADDGFTTPTPRHLKRLSLPLVNRAATLLGNGNGASSTAGSTRGHDDDPPTPSSATFSPRPTSTLGAASPSLSSNGGGGGGGGGARRGPRTYSVDFAAHAAKRIATPRTSAEGSGNGVAVEAAKGDLSPLTISLRTLTGEAVDADSSESVPLQSASEDDDVGGGNAEAAAAAAGSEPSARITVHPPANDGEEDEGMEHLSTPRQSVVVRAPSYV